MRSPTVFVAGITGVTIGLIFTAFAAVAWTGPSQTAPSGNVSAPINLGTGSQVKNGNLSVNAFTGTQDSIFYGKLRVGASTAPTYTLDVTGTTRSSGEIIGTLGSGYGQLRMIAGNYGSFWRNDGATTYLLLTASGDQYGSWNGLRPFYVDNASGGVTIGTSLSVGGNVTAAGYYHSSDARLKEHVQTSPGLAIVEKLRGVTFDWKKDGAPSAGVIAQEVEQVMPSAVKADEKGMKTVEYDQLIAPLIESIKEQQKQIEALRHEVDSLKGQH